jgi:hypothetical protein
MSAMHSSLKNNKVTEKNIWFIIMMNVVLTKTHLRASVVQKKKIIARLKGRGEERRGEERRGEERRGEEGSGGARLLTEAGHVAGPKIF